jgi:hypothetical protein
MFSVMGILRATSVWMLILLTLASGLPQMHCRCAEAQGRRYCACCFAAPDKPIDDESLAPCCRAHLAAKPASDESHRSPCPTCGRIDSPRSGGCCYWRDGSPRLVAKQIDVQNHALTLFDIAWALPTVLQPATSVAPAIAEWDESPPPVDRVILFQHLLI